MREVSIRNSPTVSTSDRVSIVHQEPTQLPDYFSLIREQGSGIEVEAMRFPIRKTFFNRMGGEY